MENYKERCEREDEEDRLVSLRYSPLDRMTIAGWWKTQGYIGATSLVAEDRGSNGQAC